MNKPLLFARTHRLSSGVDPQVKPLAFLEVADDFKQVPGLRIAVGAEHTHQALGRLRSQPAKLLKADGGVDVVAQYRLAGVHLAGSCWAP